MTTATAKFKNNNITTHTSNMSSRLATTYKAHALKHILKQLMFASAAFHLKTGNTIAHSGDTQIFVMEGTPIVNKQITTHPLKVLLANGHQVMSTHMCDLFYHRPPLCPIGTYNSGPINCFTLWHKSIDGGLMQSHVRQATMCCML
jgi:hypothetical protein